MSRRWFSGWVLAGLSSVLLGLPLAGFAAPACPTALRIGFADTASPPGLMGQGSKFADPPGWEVQAVRDALRKLGCDAELLRLPNRRLTALLAQDRVDFALLYGITPERLRTFRFPMDAQGRPDIAWAPVFGHVALFGPAGSQADAGFDGRRLRPGMRVGTIIGSVQDALAQERGWQVEAINASDTGVSMLQARRFDLLLTTRETLSPAQRANLVEWTPAVATLPYFMPAGPGVAQRNPEWTRAFWREVCIAVRQLEPDARPTECGVMPPEPGRR